MSDIICECGSDDVEVETLPSDPKTGEPLEQCSCRSCGAEWTENPESI